MEPKMEIAQLPVDIGDRSLRIRNMFRKRSGRPRSQIRSIGERIMVKRVV
jgi:hypothetical protein